MAFCGGDRNSNDVIVVVVMVTLTSLMTSRLTDADRHHGGRDVLTWYDDVNTYRHNSVLQRDDPTKPEEVYHYYYYYYYDDILVWAEVQCVNKLERLKW